MTKLNKNKVWSNEFGDKKTGIDDSGRVIRKNSYGNKSKPGSWEIDHKIPTSKGGADTYKNTRPLSSIANSAKGDKARIPSKIMKKKK